MIVVACESCYFGVRVLGDTDEVSLLVGERSVFWPDHYPCPRCGVRSRGMLESVLALQTLKRLTLFDLTPQEALAAFSGLGLPGEQNCSCEQVDTLLRTVPIRRVGAENIEGSRRCYLHHLELWDGTKIYLGAGPGGAVVYRIALPYVAAKAVAP